MQSKNDIFETFNKNHTKFQTLLLNSELYSTLPNMKLGDVMPNFLAKTTDGQFHFHDWIGDSWAILFSHPADYTPVCTTELARAADLADEFAKRGVKMIALSVDNLEDHHGWITDIQSYRNPPVKEGKFPFPLIADDTRELAVQLEMLDPDEIGKQGLPLTCRAVFIIDSSKRLRLSLLYPATTGRNFDEILRVIDSLLLTSANKVATPVDWKAGGDCMVVPSVSEEEATSAFPNHHQIPVPSNKTYLRSTPCPK